MNKSKYIISTLKTLIEIPSPSGFTKDVMTFVEKEVAQLCYASYYTNRGGLIIEVKGHSDKTIGISAHVDTLGAMVRSINSDGTINFTEVGGYTLQSVEGCYCKLHTRVGKVYTGTILCKSSSVHVFEDARTLDRTEKNMLIRLDEEVSKCGSFIGTLKRNEGRKHNSGQ